MPTFAPPQRKKGLGLNKVLLPSIANRRRLNANAEWTVDNEYKKWYLSKLKRLMGKPMS